MMQEMDRKRRWNNGYSADKKSSVMISLPSPLSKEDPIFGVKNMQTFFGVKHARVAVIFIAIILLSACLYLSFSSKSHKDNFILRDGNCPKLSYRPRDEVYVEPYQVELKKQVMMKVCILYIQSNHGSRSQTAIYVMCEEDLCAISCITKGRQ